jgi:hypothetical protein
MSINTNQYFKYLLHSLNEITNLSLSQKNEFWKLRYLALGNEIAKKNITCLPQIITLIYPDFLFNDRGNDLGELIGYSRNNFSVGINDSDNCQINTILKDGDCIFNQYRNIRGKCQADHFWPHSLGGPTIIENRILLCRFHNVAKSNSIMEKFWLEYPLWLNEYLKRLFNLKN